MTSAIFRYIDPASYDPHATEPFKKPWNKVDGPGKSYRLIDCERTVQNLRGREPEFSIDISGFGVYEAEELLKGRYQIVNAWRPIHHPASDTPLAVIDWRSMSPEDLVKVDLLYPQNSDGLVHALPDPELASLTKGYEVKGEQYAIAPNLAHRFYYMKDMTPDEIMFIKCFDSESQLMTGGKTGIAHGSGHSAFVDSQTPTDAPARQSIELSSEKYNLLTWASQCMLPSMGSPVAFGDIVAAIQTVNKITRALREHGGARENYQRLSARVDGCVSLINTIQSLDANPTSSEYCDLVSEIKSHADKMLVKLSALQVKLLRADSKLGKLAPKGWHRATVSKLSYALNKSEYESAFRQVEEDGVEIDRLLRLMNTKINLEGNIMTKESLALLKKQQPTTTTTTATATAHPSSADIRHHNTSHTQASCSANSPPSLPSPCLTILSSHMGTENPDLSEQPIMVKKNSVQDALTPRTTLHSASQQATSTLFFTTNLDLDRPEDRQTLLLLVVLCIYHELVVLCSRIGISFFPLLHILMSPAANMPMLLADNFVIQDFLGRKHSLSVNSFEDWTVLESLLKSRFSSGVAGFEKVHAGQYSIFSVDDPNGTDLNASNWTKNIGPRKRFRMSAVISGVQLTNLRCTTCGVRLRTLHDGIFSCPNGECGVFLRSLTTIKHLSRLEWKRIAGAATLEDYLQVPHEADFSTEFNRRTRRFHRMLHSDGIDNKSSLAMPSEQLDWSRFGVEHDVQDNLQDNESPETLVSRQDEPRRPSEDVDISDSLDEGSPMRTLTCVSPEAAMRERKELQYFQSICIGQNRSLYDACSSGNIEHASTLIDSGVEVDSNPGPLGTALMPAVLSHSPVLVRLLLDAHADPILETGNSYDPLSLAACYGSLQIFDDVLQAAVQNRSRKAPLRFQRAIDRALFEATLAGAFNRLPTLLLAGANPLALVGSQNTSAFEVLLGRSESVASLEISIQAMFSDHRLQIARNFLVELWSRHLLSDHEARILYRALRQEPDEAEAEGWLLNCARNLNMGRTGILSKRVARRLNGSFFFKAGIRDLGFMTLFAKEGTMYYPASDERGSEAPKPVDGATYLAALGLEHHTRPLLLTSTSVQANPMVSIRECE
ncbi:hypothetical protein NM208_g8934 [Fusarium decemcellulare]|uniref:Uncharacterized protein n=1 Tax=Fusarium decemcellulare TaxID=57161 RepID=A0ACC1S3P3_9HYPO|nr:hypothetical protein NM208_g8934 [Fusarium decemcellulare]